MKTSTKLRDHNTFYRLYVDLAVLKRSQAHRWDTWTYADLAHPKSEAKTIQDLRQGIKDSFAVHYFGSKFDEGMLKLRLDSPLMHIMDEHCPRSAEMLKSQIAKKG